MENPIIKTEFQLVAGEESQTFADPLLLAVAATKVDKRKNVRIFVLETTRREITTEPTQEPAT